MILGIDASNLRRGGGRTHLVELLKVAKPDIHGFREVVVWGSIDTLNLIEDRQWLIKISPIELEGNIIKRTFWQYIKLAKEAANNKCNLLFIPGGSFYNQNIPTVTMSRNMLPFELKELLRYGFSPMTIKLLLLRLIQSRSFRKANGVIFLTNYALDVVEKNLGELNASKKVIPHGLNNRFLGKFKIQNSISYYTQENQYRLLYVSIIDFYKHQWHLVEAVGKLRRRTGWPICLDLVGPSYLPALSTLNKSINLWDPQNEWVTYHGAINHLELHNIYLQADACVFASSCENMPNILLEMMGSGLPIVASKQGPNSEILKDGGLYFNPESSDNIADKLEELISSPQTRNQLSHKSFYYANDYSWEKCAAETFSFLASFR
jgi:glycosyltransferase involved in cell wall biosynthesis